MPIKILKLVVLFLKRSRPYLLPQLDLKMIGGSSGHLETVKVHFPKQPLQSLMSPLMKQQPILSHMSADRSTDMR